MLTESHMDPLPIIALVAIGTLYGFAWHNQPARNPERRAIEPGAVTMNALRSQNKTINITSRNAPKGLSRRRPSYD